VLSLRQAQGRFLERIIDFKKQRCHIGSPSLPVLCFNKEISAWHPSHLRPSFACCSFISSKIHTIQNRNKLLGMKEILKLSLAKS
jgi:hypothetical protein